VVPVARRWLASPVFKMRERERERERRKSLILNFQQDAPYSVCYISVGSSTCFGC